MMKLQLYLFTANVADIGNNGKNGSQTITVNISDFHQVGDSSKKLDSAKVVTNLHARFWNKNSFSVDVSSVKGVN